MNATRIIRPDVVAAPVVAVAKPVDTHPVPALGIHVNVAGDKRDLRDTYLRKSDPKYVYTMLVYYDHRRKRCMEGSPAEWAAWAARTWTWGEVP
jgi:hypothetical protein